jgi:hypothetical protein
MFIVNAVKLTLVFTGHEAWGRNETQTEYLSGNHLGSGHLKDGEGNGRTTKDESLGNRRLFFGLYYWNFSCTYIYCTMLQSHFWHRMYNVSGFGNTSDHQIYRVCATDGRQYVTYVTDDTVRFVTPFIYDSTSRHYNLSSYIEFWPSGVLSRGGSLDLFFFRMLTANWMADYY